MRLAALWRPGSSPGVLQGGVGWGGGGAAVLCCTLGLGPGDPTSTSRTAPVAQRTSAGGARAGRQGGRCGAGVAGEASWLEAGADGVDAVHTACCTVCSGDGAKAGSRKVGRCQRLRDRAAHTSAGRACLPGQTRPPASHQGCQHASSSGRPPPGSSCGRAGQRARLE